MTEPPSGTVTLLFSDVEGSTKLLQRIGDAYADLLDKHRALLRRSFEAHGGFEVDTDGDAFFVAFGSANDAVAAAAEAQQALAGHEWPEDSEIRVRIGIHTGEPRLIEQRYVGLDVHHAARVMAAGHGGQVLISQPTRDLLDEHHNLRDLGEHRLKDLSRPQRLYQLQIDGLPQEFPALKTLENRPTNLPVQPTALIGREREVEDVGLLLRRDDVQIVTLTGPGGTGKTRLSLQAAAELIEQFANGVFFVALAPISDQALVVPTIAQTLGLREQGGELLQQTLNEYLRDKQLLLVLDNFEQITAAALSVASLLRTADQVKVLVTSRTPLHVSGERTYDVPPLRLPDPARLPGFEALRQYEAVALFIERAEAAKAGFAITNENAPAIAEICVRLDGLPLALELAASRVRVLPPEALLRRLDQRLKLLTGGAQDLDERQRTLRATIEWSYELLTPEEQQLFAGLAVFVGGCTIEAVEGVCESDGPLGLDVLDGLTSLVEKSLLRHTDERFLMLETIREYASERLAETEAAARSRARHAEYMLLVAEGAAERLEGPDGLAAYSRLDAEQENLRAALTWAAEVNRADILMRLAVALGQFWMTRGSYAEGKGWFEQALARGEATDSRERLNALRWAFWCSKERGDFSAARAFAEERRALAEQLGDAREIGGALSSAAAMAAADGDYARGYALDAESVAHLRTVDEKAGLAGALGNLGERALQLGDLERARAAKNEALVLFEELGNQRGVAHVAHDLGWIALAEGLDREAERLWRENIPRLQEIGYPLTLALSLLGLGIVASERGDARRGARLAAAAERAREEVGLVLERHEQEMADRCLRSLEAHLPPDELALMWAEGRALDLDAALAYALEQEPDPLPLHSSPAGPDAKADAVG